MADKKYSPREAAIAVLKKAEELYKASTLAKADDALSSIAGDRIKRAAGYKERGEGLNHKIAMEGAKDAHQKRLQDIKEAPKPKLDKAEPTPWKGPHSSSTGVNAPLPTRETAGWKGNSQSEAGVALRHGNKQAAKKFHQETIAEQKKMPKPDLGKAEPEYKTGAEHQAIGNARQSEKAARETGASTRTGDLSNQAPKPLKGHIKLAKFVGRMEAKKMDKSLSGKEDRDKMSGKTGMLRTVETGHEKGVHTKGNQGESQGMSRAGANARSSQYMTPKGAAKDIATAKETHKEVLGEMKNIKPKLPG